MAKKSQPTQSPQEVANETTALKTAIRNYRYSQRKFMDTGTGTDYKTMMHDLELLFALIPPETE